MKIIYFHRLGLIKNVTVGSVSHFIEFSKALKELGHEVVIHPELEFDIDNKKDKYMFLGRKVRNLLIFITAEMKNIFRNFGVFIKSGKIIKNENPDLIVIRYQLYYFATVLLAKMKGISSVLEINAPMAFESRKYYDLYYQMPFLVEWIESLNLKLADAIITVSNELRQYYIEKGVNADKIFVVPNGADVERFSPNVKKIDISDKVSQEVVTIGFIGTFNKWHGIDALKEAIKACSDRQKKAKFFLIGDGPLIPELKLFISENKLDDFVEFTGIVDHDLIPKYISTMDILLAPYPKLDFFYFSPLKIFEYMSAAKAIVATRIGQIIELIDDGENGFLYDPGDYDELNNKLALIIDDYNLRKKFGDEARKKIVKGYKWKDTAQKVVDIYKAIPKTKN